MIAAICPPALRPELRAQLGELDPSQTVIPLALLDILEGMEKNHTHV
jgi:hypothetical protein